MKKFIVLSMLLHIWAIALFGDASDGASGAERGERGGRSTVSGWASSFTAKLSQAAKPAAMSSVNASTTSKRQASSAAPAAAPNQAENVTETVATTSTIVPTAPATIEPIPVIAVETINPVRDFIVPSLTIEPIVAPQSTVSTNFAAIVLPPELPNAGKPLKSTEENFAIYVPPIIERARVETSDVQPAIVPLETVAPLKLATKEFAPTPVQPPAPTPIPTPIAAVIVAEVVPLATPIPIAPKVPLVPLAPVVQVAPLAAIAPIEKIALPTAAIREFAPSPSASIAPTVEATAAKPSGANVNAATAPTNLSGAANDKLKIDKDTVGATRGGATAQSSSANTNVGGGDGLSSLLPIIPIRPAAPTLDLDRLRQQAREVAVERSGPRMLLPFPTVAKQAEKRSIEKIFDKALKRPDCRDEYVDMGLAAVVPLVRDALKGTGCKW